MIEIKQLAAQGDVLFGRIEQLPKNVVESRTDGPIVVAHSEVRRVAQPCEPGFSQPAMTRSFAIGAHHAANGDGLAGF